MSGTVSNIAAPNEDIATAGSTNSGSFTIALSSDIVGKEELYAIDPQNGVWLTIIGSGGANFDDCHGVERANPDADRPIGEWRA